MSGKALVTVVVPVWNGERFLAETLDSILAQDYPHLEVVVMDDASSDGTAALLQNYSDRVRVHRQPENRGIYATMNDGIALATGDYIAVYHADDVYEPHIVSAEAAFLEAHPEVGGVFASDVFIDGDGRELGRLRLPPEVPPGTRLGYEQVRNALLLHKNQFLRCPSAMVRASAYVSLGGYRPELFRNTSDLDLYLRLAQQHGLAVLEEHLFRYRRGHGASSERYHRLRTEPERFFLIMDTYLAQEAATSDPDGAAPPPPPPAALAAYEAHRAQDLLMNTMSLYVKDDLPNARIVLRRSSLRRLVGSPQVQRGRMALLHIGLLALVRLPRLAPVAAAFERRWAPDLPTAGA